MEAQETLSVVLAALYLRGAPRAVELRRSAWPDVLRCLRRTCCRTSEAGEALRSMGMWAEAVVLETPGLLEWAERSLASGLVLAACDPEYPCRWLRILGSSAPPALWRTGVLPALPTISFVGSRSIPVRTAQFCYRTASEAVGLGFAVVSGGAEGCDRAAARGARQSGGGVIEILPYGLGLDRSSDGCRLSLCDPSEPFSTAAAMERNVLIYAASSHTFVGQARFKVGGTWNGAVHAARSRHSTLIVRRSSDMAMRALVALGGKWLERPGDLASILRAANAQPELFESAG